jgi:adenylate kinase family enzyme
MCIEMLYCYRLFDRHIFSSRELKLLHGVNYEIEPDRRDVLLEWSSDPVLPEGPLCAGHESWGICVLRATEGLWAVLPRTGFVVWVPKCGTRLTVHPDLSQMSNHEQTAQPCRDVVNSLVTGLLSRLPAMWGELPLHTAMLKAPKGCIMLAGVSGIGKSTLSQQLARRHGWRLLDDDACMASIYCGELKVTPMGGMARLRADAAVRLQLSGPLLSGYADGKIMVQVEKSALFLPEWRPVLALFHLSRINEHPTNHTSNLYISRLDTIPAVTQAAKTALSLDRESILWRTNRFHVAAQFGKIANYSIKYNQTQTPEEVSDDIEKIYAKIH